MRPPLPLWMERPALYWDPNLISFKDHPLGQQQQQQLRQSCVYWSWTDESQRGDESNCVVTYRDLMATAALTASHLLHSEPYNLSKVSSAFQVDDQDDVNENGDDNKGPTIVVVAIPEGPWLPLAVLVVHALNATTVKAILVPLEPSDAKEHNRRILHDIQPTLILGIANTADYDRLEELVLTAKSDDDDNDNVMLWNPRLVDVRGMVHDLWSDQEQDHGYNSWWWNDFCQSIQDDGSESWTVQKWINGGIQYLSQDIKNGSTPSYLSSQVGKKESSRRISHIVYTSGTTGQPKGCVSSIHSLYHYLDVKNEVYGIHSDSRVLLASALSFDPCFSDILATMYAYGRLALCPRSRLLESLSWVVRQLEVTHVLCTPTLWGMVDVNDHPQSFSSLEVVALGGEPIPLRVQKQWARQSEDVTDGGRSTACRRPRLFATYGVTEACVYQTAGEVRLDDHRPVSVPRSGQCVGLPFRGLHIRICEESIQDTLMDVGRGETGEVVLYGAQLDSFTGYWKRPELSYKFVAEVQKDGTTRHYYRTGDRGILDTESGSLTILGRIVGEESMVKVNGVRIELGEIESAVIDDVRSPSTKSVSSPPPVVESCVVRVIQSGDETSPRSEIHAYCVLSDQALSELNLPLRDNLPMSGMLVTGGVLLTLLRARCVNSLKAACIPSAFIILPRLPLSPTGKLDRRRLPLMSEAQSLDNGESSKVLLKDYGRLGQFLAELIRECMNLQPLQQEMMTTSATLDMMGGDSLAATRIIRALYAHHHQIDNNRYLGGDYGRFEGVFDVVHLIRAKSLGDYVDMLERHKIGERAQDGEVHSVSEEKEESVIETRWNPLNEALVHSSTKGQSSIAIALLQAGADPNGDGHGKRLGKVSGGFFYRKFAFHSSPLHLACKHGDEKLVEHLLHWGANCKSPDAAGLYPLHLVASSITGQGGDSTPEDDARRLRCVVMLLDAGAPIVMRDGNHQSILHAAARSGHSSILRHIMTVWKDSGKEDPTMKDGKKFINWLDRWYRTPVHWAILNGRLEALKVVLEYGCTPLPYKPKTGKRTSVATEYPMELCDRLYPEDSLDETKREMGTEIRQLLTDAISKMNQSNES